MTEAWLENIAGLLKKIVIEEEYRLHQLSLSLRVRGQRVKARPLEWRGSQYNRRLADVSGGLNLRRVHL